MTDTIDYSNNMKRSKKPKPLFGIFRKNKPDPVIVVPSQSTGALSSGITHTFQQFNHGVDPYAPPKQPKTNNSDERNQLLSPQFTSTNAKQQQYQRRPRSKSVGRDPSSSYNHNSNHMRLMEERESALYKLCQKEKNSPTSSLVDSLPLLSPTYTPPPVPPIPLRHQQQNSISSSTSPRSPRSPQQKQPPPMRKFSSAHDLRKVSKQQQQELMAAQAQGHPLPTMPIKKDLSRSKSLNHGPPLPRKLQPSKSQQHHQHMPTTPNVMALSRPRWPPIRSERDDDDDDDIPLGYLQSPISRPSSLLSDKEEDDDKDLVPIAALATVEYSALDVDYQTAADKYKEKVKERLQFDTVDDDDDIPISLLSCIKK